MITRSLPSLRLVLTSAACIVSLAACGSDDVGDDGTTGSTGATSMSSSASEGATSSSSADASSGPTSDASESATSDDTSGPTSDASESATSDDTTSTSDTTGTTEDPTSTSGDTTGIVQSGLEAFCSHYVDCGGTYYEDEAACIDASLSYWGECPSRRDAQDVFGECMAEIPCDEWNPDAYNPNNTVCAEQWQALGDSEPC